jgi:hypothetical protein
MNITAANWTEYKGETVTIQTVDGSALEGSLISLNSKGWNIKDAAGKTITRTLGVTVDISTGSVEGVEDLPEDWDLEDEGAIEDLLTEAAEAEHVDTAEGHTTAELADIFNTSTRELRKTLRALGLGVGRGRRYNLSDDDLTTVRKAIVKA